MPQMAPMNWVMLLIMFTLVFLTFNSMNFFLFKYQPKMETNKMNKKNFNWKW